MIFYSSNPRLKQIQVTSLTNASNKIQLIKILRQKFSFFLAKENLFKQIKEAEVLSLWQSNKKRYLNLARFARKYLLAPPPYVYSLLRLFFGAGNLYKQKLNLLSTKTGENFLFLHHNLKKTRIGFFIA